MTLLFGSNMIVFNCPACGKHFEFSDRFAGRNMLCAGCKSEIVVPEPNSLPVPPPVPVQQSMQEPEYRLNSVPMPPPLPPGYPVNSMSTPPQESVREPMQEPPQKPAPVSSVDWEPPVERPAWKRNLLFWGGIGSMLFLIVGGSVYSSLFVDWSGEDPRFELRQRISQQKTEAILEAKDKETESELLRFRAVENWNRAGETIDAILVTQRSRDEIVGIPNNRQVEDSALSIRAAEDRIDELRRQARSIIREAATQEIQAVVALKDSQIAREASDFYQKQETDLDANLREFAKNKNKERHLVSVDDFKPNGVGIGVDEVIRFDGDWTEFFFERFDFPGMEPDRFLAAFDGMRRAYGTKSLRVSVFEKIPIVVQFPKGRDARQALDAARYFIFSLCFPDFDDPIRIGKSSESGKVGQIVVRFGNPAGYVDFEATSSRYCETLFFESRGRFVGIEIPLEGDDFWRRSDHFDLEKLTDDADSIETVLNGEPRAGDYVPGISEAPENAPDFFSRIDWIEIRFTPLGEATTLWLDGVMVSEKPSHGPFDLLRAEARQADLRQLENEFFEKRSVGKPSPIAGKSSKDSSEIEAGETEDDKTEMNSDDNSLATGPLEFDGADEQRMQKLFYWVLRIGKGRIRVQINGQSVSLGAKSEIPTNLEKAEIEEVDLTGYRHLTASQLDSLGELKNLKRLNLSRTGISDGVLIKLATLTSLESLNLNGNELSFEGLPSIRTLKGLKELHLDGMRSGRGVDALGTFTSLRVLTLSRSGLGGSDLNSLLPLVDLETLDVSGTRLEDRGLSVLRVFTELQSLNISKTKITDEGIKSLTSLRKLRKLNIDGTALTDGCLKDLGSISSLESISALRTEMTLDGVRKTLGPNWTERFKISKF